MIFGMANNIQEARARPFANVLGGSTGPSSHARNSLYPTDKAIAPSNRPIAPIVMNPPMAPKNTIMVGTATPRPSRRGLSTLSIRPTKRHQTRKITALVVLAVANM